MSKPPSLTPYMPPLTFTYKRKSDEHETIALGEECSIVVQNKLATKCKHADSFSILCLIGNVNIDRALYDLGSSVHLMPYSIFKRLDLGKLQLTLFHSN